MSGWTPERWTGIAGIVTTVMQVIAFVVGYAAGAPTGLETANGVVPHLQNGGGTIEPPALLFFGAFGVLFVFLAGIRAMLVGADAKLDQLGTAVFGFGSTIAILGFVSLGLLAAAAANARGTPDVPAVHAMFLASGVLGGAPIALAPAFFLIAPWVSLPKSPILPPPSRWPTSP